VGKNRGFYLFPPHIIRWGGPHFRRALFCVPAAALAARSLQRTAAGTHRKWFGMARARDPLIIDRGRIQTARHANDVVYMGPAAHTPLLSEMIGVLRRLVAAHSKPQVLPPPYGGEQGREGKSLPYPSKGFQAPFP